MARPSVGIELGPPRALAGSQGAYCCGQGVVVGHIATCGHEATARGESVGIEVGSLRALTGSQRARRRSQGVVVGHIATRGQESTSRDDVDELPPVIIIGDSTTTETEWSQFQDRQVWVLPAAPVLDAGPRAQQRGVCGFQNPRQRRSS